MIDISMLQREQFLINLWILNDSVLFFVLIYVVVEDDSMRQNNFSRIR